MRCINRLEQYDDIDFDKLIIKIKKGEIKCGKYAHLIKIDKNYKIKGKEIFK